MRKIHNIEANNYGFYIYRNKRLISWAEHLDGIIPFQQELYALRARILLDDSADDPLNIDVKKSLIVLSDEAHDAIDNLSADIRRKSITAWNERSRKVKEITEQGSHDTAEEVIEATKFPDEKPGDADDAQTIKTKAEREKKINDKASTKKPDPKNSKSKGKSTNGEKGSSDDTEQADESSKIKIVDFTTDNVLWEMYYDAQLGTCVKINKHHRFSQLIYDHFATNKQLTIVMDAFFFTLTEAQKHTIKSLTDIDQDIIEKVLDEFITNSSFYLQKTAQSIEKIVQ
jgi:hypothetical protein